jgi:hypothetical protein
MRTRTARPIASSFMPSLKTLKKLARALEIDVFELLSPERRAPREK